MNVKKWRSLKFFYWFTVLHIPPDQNGKEADMFKTLFYIIITASAHAQPSYDQLTFARTEVPAEANFFELALLAAQRVWSGNGILNPEETLAEMGRMGKRDMRSICARGENGVVLRTNTVTHYYVPLLKTYSEKTCKYMEGVCRFWKNGEEYIANYGKPNEKLRDAFCKNGVGYGLKENCTHPCRSLAASTKFHRGGEVIFFPELVGKKCGTGANQMIHDGFMVVNDTGDSGRFNRTGRFDFFWGECRKFKGGVCRDSGAIEVTRILSGAKFCRAWRPQDPTYNTDLKIAFYNAVRTEAISRGDGNAAMAFDLDAWVSPSHKVAGKKLAAKVAAEKRKRSIASAR